MFIEVWNRKKKQMKECIINCAKMWLWHTDGTMGKYVVGTTKIYTM